MRYVYTAHYSDRFHNTGCGKVRYTRKYEAVNACHAYVLDREACARRDMERFARLRGEANIRYSEQRRSDSDSLAGLLGRLASLIPSHRGAHTPMLDVTHNGFRVYVKRHAI